MMFEADYFYSSAPSDISSDVTEPELRACQLMEDTMGPSIPSIPPYLQQPQYYRKPGTKQSLTKKLRIGLFRKGEKSKGDR